MSGEVHEKRAKSGGGEAFSEILHDAAIGRDAVKDDYGAGWIGDAGLDNANGNPAVTGGYDDIANEEWPNGGEPNATAQTQKTEKQSNARAAVHLRFVGRQNGA